MATETKMEWEVVEGFGDIVDSPNECFDVEVVARFASEADAEAFAEDRYEKKIGSVQRQMPDWWQSYFVVARQTQSRPTAEKVAIVFDRLLTEAIGEGAYAEVLRRNRTPEYDRACASHDFCDANVVMMEAMLECGVDADTDGGHSLLNAAWDAWREKTK